MIYGAPIESWYELFSMCHEHHTDGGHFQKKMGVKKVMNIKTGYYTRVCLPCEGTILQQPHLIMLIFNIIKDELTRAMRHRMR